MYPKKERKGGGALTGSEIMLVRFGDMLKGYVELLGFGVIHNGGDLTGFGGLPGFGALLPEYGNFAHRI